MHTVIYRAEHEGRDSMPLRRRSGVQGHFGIQRYSTITDTWFDDTPRTEEPKPAFLLVAQGPQSRITGRTGQDFFCETDKLWMRARHEASDNQDNGLLPYAVSRTRQPWHSSSAEGRM